MDGLDWNKINQDGFGDRNNLTVLWNSSTIEYLQHLYIGTENRVNGAEIWQLYAGFPMYLPVVKR